MKMYSFLISVECGKWSVKLPVFGSAKGKIVLHLSSWAQCRRYGVEGSSHRMICSAVLEMRRSFDSLKLAQDDKNGGKTDSIFRFSKEKTPHSTLNTPHL